MSYELPSVNWRRHKEWLMRHGWPRVSSAEIAARYGHWYQEKK
jgi:hypothetical protein